MSRRTAIVWFRQDLRLRDNPALRHAADDFDHVLPVFIWSPEHDGDAALGSASRVWLHFSLNELSERIRKFGGRLLIQAGDPREILPKLGRAVSAQGVFWNRRYEPALTTIDLEVATLLSDAGYATRSFKANLLFEPWDVTTNDGRPYQVFTPFWKSAQRLPEPDAPLAEVRKIDLPSKSPDGLRVDQLELLPKVRWDEGIRSAWSPGELGARQRLRDFLSGPVGKYKEGRDFPAENLVSRLSPHLHFGEISPRQIVHDVHAAGIGGGGAEAFLRQLGWRELAHHVLYNFPHTVTKPLQPKFGSFRWRTSPKDFEAWQKGQTGYPIVDAGMRQLWKIGWMHNRVRMIVASFLVKDLLIHWRQGAAWFWDTLVDADQPNNTLGWQWAAGCGADAAPYFRIFNPVSQGEKFDPDGDYVRRWVPELAQLPSKWIHRPWDAPEEMLEAAGVKPGETYPRRIVNHAEVRLEALKRFKAL